MTTPLTVVVGLSWSVVDDTDVIVVETAIVVIVEWGADVVPTIEVVASWAVVVLASAVVVALLHLHNCDGQNGATWLQLAVHH